MVAFHSRPTVRRYVCVASSHLPWPSAMYIRQPEITTPSKRLNAKTYSAFVDCCSVRPMMITGSRKAGLLKARKIRVSRIRRSTTKPPPSDFTNRAITPGRMAARSIRFDGMTTNFSTRKAGPGKWMGWYPMMRSRSLTFRKSSMRTFQQVASLMKYSRQKSIKHAVSMSFRTGDGVGAPPSRLRTWNCSIVERMKQHEDTTITASTISERTCAKMEQSGSSKVRKILSHKDSRTLMFRCL
mmetsp:Transcript_29942/g.69628  ORF Transcript_29942/g.69628 Transcript_29942/m.69628 type:complete len:241 (-) Transcript_29942:371-1093(-)